MASARSSSSSSAKRHPRGSPSRSTHRARRFAIEVIAAATFARVVENERLARLVDDVPLPAGPLSAPFDEAAKARLATFFEELELRSLLPRLAALA